MVVSLVQIPTIPIEISKNWSRTVEESEDLLNKSMAKIYQSQQALSNFQQAYSPSAQHPPDILALQESDMALLSAWEDLECLAVHINQLQILSGGISGDLHHSKE